MDEQTKNDESNNQEELPPLKNPWELLVSTIVRMAEWLDKKPDEFEKWADQFEEEKGEATFNASLFLLSMLFTIPLVSLTLYSVLTIFRVYPFWDVVGQIIWAMIFGFLMFISGLISWELFLGIFEGIENDQKRAEKKAKEEKMTRNQ